MRPRMVFNTCRLPLVNDQNRLHIQQLPCSPFPFGKAASLDQITECADSKNMPDMVDIKISGAQQLFLVCTGLP